MKTTRHSPYPGDRFPMLPCGAMKPQYAVFAPHDACKKPLSWRLGTTTTPALPATVVSL
jgi:hypothetical protein